MEKDLVIYSDSKLVALIKREGKAVRFNDRLFTRRDQTPEPKAQDSAQLQRVLWGQKHECFEDLRSTLDSSHSIHQCLHSIGDGCLNNPIGAVILSDHSLKPVHSFIYYMFYNLNLLRYRFLQLSIVLLLCGSPYVSTVFAAAQADDATSFVRTTDLTHLQQLSQPAISPDGSKAVYVVQSVVKDDEEYRYVNQLWLVDLEAEGDPVQITQHRSGASQPAWHPHSDRLAFTRSSNNNNSSQIFVIYIDGGEARQYTDAENGGSSAAWSPDGQQLLFASSYSQNTLLDKDEFADGPQWPHEKPGISPLPPNNDITPDPDGSMEQVRAWLAKNEAEQSPAILNRLDFQGEFDLSPQRSYTHWFVMDNEPMAEPLPLTLGTGFFSFENAVWMPDGERIILSANMDTTMHPDRSMERSLYHIPSQGGSPELLAGQEHYQFNNPTPSPDGRYVSFRAFDTRERGYNQAEIGVLHVQNGEITYLGEQLDRSLSNATWSSDSRHIYATAPKNGGVPLFRFDLQDRSYERLSGYDSGIRDFSFSDNTLIYIQTDFSNPFELYRATTDMSQTQRISDHNYAWISERTISEPVKHSYTTDDGFEIDYWVMKPAGASDEGSYPTLLQIHGGPSAMWGPGDASMWHEFQLFAAHGFGVVFSNPRGSGGYGYDFQSANRQDWGDSPMNDVLGALDQAIDTNGWIDEDQLVLTGGSYGGYLVAYTLAFDHRFKAAAAQRGVYELNTFFGEGNAYRLVNDQFSGYPWEEEISPILRQDSPFTHVHHIQTPLMILHGSSDLRTGVSQSEMMYRALKILERDVEYVRYPGGGHDLSRTGDVFHRKDRLLRMIEFMKRYVD